MSAMSGSILFMASVYLRIGKEGRNASEKFNEAFTSMRTFLSRILTWSIFKSIGHVHAGGSLRRRNYTKVRSSTIPATRASH